MTKWFWVVALLFLVCGCSSCPDLPQAKNYEVLTEKTIDAADRTRMDARIFAADAHSPDECAQTAMKAAYDLRNKHTVYVMRVFLEKDKKNIGQGNISARAVWSPDGQGFSGVEKKEWEVATVDDRGEHPYEMRQK